MLFLALILGELENMASSIGILGINTRNKMLLLVLFATCY